MSTNNTRHGLSTEDDYIVIEEEHFFSDSNTADDEEDIILDDEDNYVEYVSGTPTKKYDYDDNILEEDEEYVRDEADEAFEKAERKHKFGSALRLIVLLVSAAIFCYSAYMLFNIFSEYKRDADTNKKIDSQIVDSDTSVTVPLPDGETVVIPFKYDHEALTAINSEGLGYIYVPGINKRLPIVQTDNNEYYLRHALDHTWSMAGSIFEDYRIKDKLNSSHVVLHGHNRQDGTMFAWLENYLKEKFYKQNNHDVFYIYTENKVMQYKIFSVYISEPVSDTYMFNFSTLGQLQEYAVNMKAKSIYETGIDVSNATQVVTLSTCTDDIENRIIVHGVLTNTAELPE